MGSYLLGGVPRRGGALLARLGAFECDDHADPLLPVVAPTTRHSHAVRLANAPRPALSGLSSGNAINPNSSTLPHLAIIVVAVRGATREGVALLRGAATLTPVVDRKLELRAAIECPRRCLFVPECGAVYVVVANNARDAEGCSCGRHVSRRHSRARRRRRSTRQAGCRQATVTGRNQGNNHARSRSPGAWRPSTT